MKTTKAIFIVLILFVLGCARNPPSQNTNKVVPDIAGKTQLQIRQIQTQTYDTNDTGMLMKAMVNVLQDDGFMVQNADVEMGLLTATKETTVFDNVWYEKAKSDIEHLNSSCLPFFYAHWPAPDPSYFRINMAILTTINVSRFGEQTRVRANFQQKVVEDTNKKSQCSFNSGQIEDEQYYQNFFSKVDKGIFIQKEKL